MDSLLLSHEVHLSQANRYENKADSLYKTGRKEDASIFYSQANEQIEYCIAAFDRRKKEYQKIKNKKTTSNVINSIIGAGVATGSVYAQVKHDIYIPSNYKLKLSGTKSYKTIIDHYENYINQCRMRLSDNSKYLN